MVFRSFVEINGKRQYFTYPEQLEGMNGSIFSMGFDLNNLSPIKGGISAGSIGINFYDKNLNCISAAIQIRSDLKPNILDIDCFTRKFFPEGIKVPKGYTSYKEAEFHNNPYEKVCSGLTVGFCKNAREIKQEISKEEIQRLFVQN